MLRQKITLSGFVPAFLRQAFTRVDPSVSGRFFQRSRMLETIAIVSKALKDNPKNLEMVELLVDDLGRGGFLSASGESVIINSRAVSDKYQQLLLSLYDLGENAALSDITHRLREISPKILNVHMYDGQTMAGLFICHCTALKNARQAASGRVLPHDGAVA